MTSPNEEGSRTLDISPDDFERIASEIRSESSPVGFDALKTHVLILNKLTKIEARLKRLEQLSDEKSAT